MKEGGSVRIEDRDGRGESVRGGGIQGVDNALAE